MMTPAAEMNFAIRHVTIYDYDAEVVDNLNALRVRPASNSRQRVDEFSVRLNPEVRVQQHSDYFGTQVVEFEVSRPHQQLTIDVRARVSTKSPDAPPEGSWGDLRDPDYMETGGEFLIQTASIFQTDQPPVPQLADLLATTRQAPTPLACVMQLSELIPQRFEYRRGATYVDSTVADLLDGGAGVCQDFVHLGLAILRHHGIAARYVSGYLFATSSGVPVPNPEDGQESIEVDTHAWLEALLPTSGDGDPVWVGADPTNGGLVVEDHVKIGHGRHYPDVPPIKGVYRGAAESTLNAKVTMTRLQKADPASSARN